MADLDAEVDDPYSFEQWEEEPTDEAKIGGEARPQSNGSANEEALGETGRLAVRNPDTAVSETTRPSSSGAHSSGFRDADHEEALVTMVSGIALKPDNEPQGRDGGSVGRRSSPGSSLHLVPTHVESTDPASGSPGPLSMPVAKTVPRVRTTHQESTLSAGDLDPVTNTVNTRLDTSVEVLGPEGPMTPRNDAGPFVFDGSAGRASGERVAASLNDAAADIGPDKD
jgi:E3 ubiquitin-protein ligase DMA1/2